MYEYLDQVLANYFSATVGQSEEEAVSTLRIHVANNPQLASGLHRELLHTLKDKTFSWKQTLAEHSVLFTESEEEARAYANKILWENLFATS